MALDVYSHNHNASKQEYYFKQIQIVELAQRFSDGIVRPARVSQWTCADSKNHTYNYLRGDWITNKSLRRLSAPNECNGIKTVPVGIDSNTDFRFKY